jgi:hypothetical protein
MIWIIDQEPVNGVMFDGQRRVRVRNKRTGLVGEAKVEYFPNCCVVGPVTEQQEYTADGDPANQPQVIDSRPKFK